MAEQIEKEELLSFTSEIVAAYMAHNTVAQDAIPEVIQSVYKALKGLDQDPDHMTDRPKPAVPINKSLTPDYIVCLEDGKQLKMLKRHLNTSYKMSPEQYRERWGLPADYPMTAPNYAKKRSKLAKDIGLGKS